MVDIAYQPVFESQNSKFTLKVGGESSDANLSYDTIVCQAGARYASYCANVGRTFFVNPSEQKKKVYAAAVEAHAAAVKALVKGGKAGDVYAAAEGVLREKGEGLGLVDRLGKNVGSAIGLELRDCTWELAKGSDKVLKAGMTFNVVLALNGLTDAGAAPDGGDGKTSEYAVLISDTVLVGDANEKDMVLTGQVTKDWNDIAYYLGDDDEEEEEEGDDDSVDGVDDQTTKATRRTPVKGVRKSARTEQVDFKEREEERKRQMESQAQLLEKVNQATLNILDNTSGDKVKERKVTDVISYKSVADVRQVRLSDDSFIRLRLMQIALAHVFLTHTPLPTYVRVG